MRYHDIVKDDMRNGDGLRVTLFLAGCNHHCPGCQNPITWDPNGGLDFYSDWTAMWEIIDQLAEDYISGLTLSGGDPFHPVNRRELLPFVTVLKMAFPDMTIWCYTGYSLDEIKDEPLTAYCDVIVDGRFKQELADVTYEWAGSTNQNVYRKTTTWAMK